MILWELLLKCKEDEVCEQLSRLYEEFEGVKPLASHLGVSRATLLAKLRGCNVTLRRAGGPHYKVPREILPKGWEKMDTEQIVRITGYSPNYVRKLRRNARCASVATTKTDTEQS